MPTEDLLEIQQLYARYTFAFDFHDMDTYLSLWAEDCELAGRKRGSSKGKAEIRERVAWAMADPGHNGFMWYTNLVIEPAEFGARGRCYFLHVLTPDGIMAQPDQALYLEDELVKEDGDWKFRRREMCVRSPRPIT